MKVKVFVFFFFALFLLLLAGCGSEELSTTEPVDQKDHTEEDTDSTKTKPENKDEVKPTGNVVEVSISAINFEFDVKEIKANVGDTVKLTLVNEIGGHGIAIDEFDVDVKGGDTIEFVVTEAGEFEYFCSLLCGVGHDIMVGKLIVT
ncbi:cytochrome C oxidase subunit II [Metabacillus sediminilitoris]|uniref:Cytochrome C oxidase subunit II n=1 Tax=Metabacillus sediminilitoris TaxID=2567941 RepID=A0A4S4BWT8_9BACI|nr:cytochrome C oxidase subunit II [Metabacillus sediminilitoris]QGQ45965.1 cytochrome C oxidase subunit II [Metabacillus sediminilitoris]THF79649.1 cytochrome C oxidase subunit II [Metabacillus sediminilitoris]